MRINIDKGSLLKSKIKNAEIIIKNFHKENTPLEIRGKVTGRAEDLIKHVNYKTTLVNIKVTLQTQICLYNCKNSYS